MSKVIIGIHGLANKPPEAELRQSWRTSLQEGLTAIGAAPADFEYDMVYWAGSLYKNPQHNDPLYSFDSLFNDEPYVAASDGSIKEYKDSWVDDVRATARATVGKLADLRRVYFGESQLLHGLLDSKLKDLAFYYDPNRVVDDGSGSGRPARQVLDGDLAACLRRHRGKDILLIAHSMGTIISYNVLRDLGREAEPVPIRRFVTIGSPLGLPYVKGRIIDERDYDPRVRCPSVVTERWVNFADRRDPVAVDLHLADDYGPNANDVAVRDDLVFNGYLSPAGDGNAHKSYGYLRTPELAGEVQSFLES